MMSLEHVYLNEIKHWQKLRYGDLYTNLKWFRMKLKNRVAKGLMFTAGILLALTANAQTLRNGTFKSVQGEVNLTQASMTRVAEVGAGLNESDHLVTGRNASTTFTLKDGTVVTVGPNTTMDLSKLQFDPTTQNGSFALNLLQGTIRVVTGLLGKLHPEQVNITTPTSVVGVRGTDFIVEVP
jgi:hypothetical protein